MLEPKTLKETPVPDPTNVPTSSMRRLVRLVDERLMGDEKNMQRIEKQMDIIVSDLYDLNEDEQEVLGVEKHRN